ncbi:synaptophysin-like protein 1 [Elgaria multicarinata webbii]|uniref:synaptophysin-like protein 1 n=1 Tax=Elgaria multicarinata webbii TaxID=159646 RepID=UPI002FCD22B0
MSAPELNLAPIKEPLGFIKILQWIFSIFAFATCGGYSGKTSLVVNCPKGNNETIEVKFAYPFRLNTASIGPPDIQKCNVSWTQAYVLVGNYGSSAQFFVTFAVFVFLYCMAALGLYLCYFRLYRGAGKLPLLDFAVTVIISFLWLVSTSTWAKALTDIKVATGPNFVDELLPCKPSPQICTFNDIRSMGSLNVSVVIGFLNLILWAGNAWFVYKETSLHTPPANASPNPTNPSP